jgi:hypothetical protein
MLSTCLSLLLLVASVEMSSSTDASHDFDFFMGSWKAHNRFLKARLAGSKEWIEFESRVETKPLEGLGNIDHYTGVRQGKLIEGMTVRLFDPNTGVWSLYWADNVRPGVFQPPMRGKFANGIGEFFGDEEVNGRKVLCRFRWTQNGGISPRWEQAFSDDDGKTWESYRTYKTSPAAGARLARAGNNSSDTRRCIPRACGILR